MNASVCLVILVPAVLSLFFLMWLAAEFVAGKVVRIALGLLCFVGLMVATCWGFYWAFAWHFQAMSAADTMSVAQRRLEAGEVAEAQRVLGSYLTSQGR